MKSILLSIVLTLIVSVSPAGAKDVSQEQMIAALYIAYYERGASKAELDTWLASNSGDTDTLKTLSTLLLNQSNNIFENLGNQGFIETIYTNALNKEGDAETLLSWVTQLNLGLSRSDMVIAYLEKFLGSDFTATNFPSLSSAELLVKQRYQTLLTNRVDVALYFSKNLGTVSNITNTTTPADDPAYLAAIKIIQGVNEDADTVTTAKNYINTVLTSSDAIAKINRDFKWLDDIVMSTVDSVSCSNKTFFTVTPSGNPTVKFSTDASTGSTTVTLSDASTGSIRILNCSKFEDALVEVTHKESRFKSTNYFLVELDAVMKVDGSVSYRTQDGTAIAGQDYTATSGTATILAGDKKFLVAIEILNDSIAEFDETFQLILSNPTGGSFPTGITEIVATHTILDDDIETNPKEGNINNTNYFLLELSEPMTVDGSVNYATQDGTAIAGQDYTATSGTMTISAGDRSVLIPVEIIGDTIAESDETFKLIINNPIGGVFPTGVSEITATHTIVNDD